MECLIRPWKLEDAGDLAAALNNQNVIKNLRDGIPFPYTQADGEEYIQAMQESEASGLAYAFAVTVGEEERKAVGSIAIFRGSNIHYRTAELGYYLAEPLWGQGIMTSAVRQICQFAFERTDILRIFADPFDYNIGSCRVLEKAGFQFEGVLRKNAVKEGQVLDMRMYALVRE